MRRGGTSPIFADNGPSAASSARFPFFFCETGGMEPALPLRHIRLVSLLSGEQLVDFRIEVTARMAAVRLEAAKLMGLQPYQLRFVDGDGKTLSLIQPVAQEDELSCEIRVLIVGKENGYDECYCGVYFYASLFACPSQDRGK